MQFEVLISVLAGLVSLLFGGSITSKLIRETLQRILGKKQLKKTYTERLSELTTNLTKASTEVDAILLELSNVAVDRENSLKDLEANLVKMENREKELRRKISALQNVPIPVAEYFAKLVEPGEKRSAKRDYLLFGAGVIVTTIVAVILQLFTTK
jgi:septal ring factor EnvC (AmiA/AmiB activator)